MTKSEDMIYLFLLNCDLCFPTFSDAVDSVTSLYNHVEEQAHILVQRSNMSLEHLQYLLQVRELEEHFTQVLYIMQTSNQRTKITHIR